MSRCEITLTANAGVMLRLGRSVILVDALHDRQVQGWSTLTPERWQALQELLPAAGPDLILFTHCHPDHFSPRLAAEALERWPGVRQALPEARLPGQRLLDGRRERLNLPDVTIHLARLPHEGEQFKKVRHYGCILEHDGFRILIPGDCALCAEELADFADECGPVDLAVMDFPWLTLRRGREFLLERLRPGQILIDHLPFAQDDAFSYRTAARKAAAQWQGPPLTLLTEPFQRVVI